MHRQILRAHGRRLLAPPAFILSAVFLCGLLLNSPHAAAQCRVPSFAPPAGFTTGARPVAIATADFNTDGRLDVLTLNATTTGGSLVVLPGDGKGAFGAALVTALSFAPVVRPFAVAPPGSLVVGDFDRDGAPDVAALTAPGNVRVFLGDGRGGFVLRGVFGPSSAPASLAALDFDADGDTDLVTVNAGGNLSLLRGDGRGTFLMTHSSFMLPATPLFVAAGDLNGDARADLAVSSFQPSGQAQGGGQPLVSVLLATGEGGFIKVNEFRNSSLGSPAKLARIADLNSDGNADLALDVGGSFLGDGRGGFDQTATNSISSGPALADFNGDGRTDIVGSSGRHAYVHTADGAGDFPLASAFALTSDPTLYVGAVAAGDFNGDGRADLAATNVSQHDDAPKEVRLLLNTCAPAAARTFTVAGRVTDLDYRNGLNRIQVSLRELGPSGGHTFQTLTDAAGRFSFPAAPGGRAYELLPARDGMDFRPPSFVIADLASDTAKDFETAVPPEATAHDAPSFVPDIMHAHESDGALTITVRRAGHNSLTRRVRFKTVDSTPTEPCDLPGDDVLGAARPGCDYTPASGVLVFAPGETVKTFSVPLVNDERAEPPESLRLTLFEDTGADAPAVGGPAFVTIMDDDARLWPTNMCDDTRYFVRRHYLDFLGREADEAGFGFWQHKVESCGADAHCREVARVDTSTAFFLSIEFQQTGYRVFRVYQATFADAPARPGGFPRFQEFLLDSRDIGRGIVVGEAGWGERLHDNVGAFARGWVARPEFAAAFPEGMTAEQFVDKLFANARVSAPPQREREEAVIAFGAGDAAGRARALLAVVDSGSVFNAQYNRAAVLMQYFGYLRRNPDDPPDGDFRGYDFWLAKLDGVSQPGEDVRGGLTAHRRLQRAEMVRAFLESIEYRRRFEQ